MGCPSCTDSHVESGVRFVRRSDWPKAWIQEAAPGDLLLLPGIVGQASAILRLSVQGVFVLLDPDQVWRRKVVPWPFEGDKVISFRLVGHKIEYRMR